MDELNRVIDVTDVKYFQPALSFSNVKIISDGIHISRQNIVRLIRCWESGIRADPV